MTTHARPPKHEAPACPTRHDTVASASVLAAIVLTILYGVGALSFDPAFDTTAATFEENRNV